MSSSEPVARRPRFPPGYGVPSTPAGMLDWIWATEQLASARNYWVVTSGADGMPHAAPVWGLWIDGVVVFSTSRESRKGCNLLHDPRVVIHLESGDDVVILEGDVEEMTLDGRLADAYEKKYAYRPGSEPGGFWLSLSPRVAYAWRESDYPRSATRFEFGQRGRAPGGLERSG